MIKTLPYNLRPDQAKLFEQILAQYWGLIIRASKRVAFDPDWMQEAKILLYEFIKNWDPESGRNFRRELYGLMWRESSKFHYHNYRKKQKVEDQRGSEALDQLSQSVEYLQEQDRKWVKDRLKEIVKAYLSEKDARILYLYFYRGLTHEHIADKLALDRTTITHRLNDALKELKQTLEIKELYQFMKEIY